MRISFNLFSWCTLDTLERDLVPFLVYFLNIRICAFLLIRFLVVHLTHWCYYDTSLSFTGICRCNNLTSKSARTFLIKCASWHLIDTYFVRVKCDKISRRQTTSLGFESRPM